MKRCPRETRSVHALPSTVMGNGKKRRLGVVDPPGIVTHEMVGRSSNPKRQKVGDSSTLSTLTVEGSPDDVYNYFLIKNLSEVASVFKDHGISGKHLQKLTSADLNQMKITEIGVQNEIFAAIGAVFEERSSSCMEKVFNDPIHGHMEVHPLMVKIIDTPQFQRLRHIKQLGGAYFVFIGASHNRFEHSIGVGYLAGELVETLQKKQPELSISDKDVLCVKIAGLCHDLGHGPFSHLFDSRFIPLARPGINWRHEQASVMMFDHLLKVNNLHADFNKYGLYDDDILFIKEQIGSVTESTSEEKPCWPYKGRSADKSFLYEVVANKRNGIDVDKWEYFARDCHCLGIPNNFDMRRYMKFARVITVGSRTQICTRDKEVYNLYEMFHTRIFLHRRAYQHKTCNIIEYMITEALLKADNYLLIRGEKSKVKMSEAIDDPYAYTRLTDNVYQQILASEDDNFKEAREILQKVERRQLYVYIGQAQPILKDECKDDEVKPHEVIQSLDRSELGDLPELTSDDIVVETVTYDYGMKDADPIEHVRFYMKNSPMKPVKVRREQVSRMLPQIFREKSIRMYCKLLDPDSIEAAKRYFMSWCQKHACVSSNDQDHSGGFSVYTTPLRDSSHGKSTMSDKDCPKSKKKLHF